MRWKDDQAAGVGARAAEDVPRLGSRRRSGGRALLDRCRWRWGRSQRKANRCGLDTGDIAVAKATGRMARIVARKGDPQRGLLLSHPRAEGPIAGAQHGGGGGQVSAGIERVLDRQAEAFKIGAVDLGETQIEIGAAE